MTVATFLFILRFVHIVAGLGWVGEVLPVNVVLIPTLERVDSEVRQALLDTAFPLVFRLATVLGGLAVTSGIGLFLIMSHAQPALLLTTAWGQRILLGGMLGGGLFVFHLIQESRAERSLAHELAALQLHHDPVRRAVLLRRLALFPRLGGIVLLSAVALMSAAARLP